MISSKVGGQLKKFVKAVPYMAGAMRVTAKLARMAYEHISKYEYIEIVAAHDLRLIQIPEYTNLFCGYYDVSPFRPNDPDYILIHATNASVYSLPTIHTKIDLLLYQISTAEWRLLDSTPAWNWQQGSRLQWIDNCRIAYNIIYEHEVRCCLLNVDTGKKEILPIPLSIVESQDKIISIDYCALTAASEYGYPGISQKSCASEVQVYDYRKKDLVTVLDWKLLGALARPGATRQHINHILYSPDRSRFVFIFRYWVDNKRLDSLIEYNLNTKKVREIIINQTVSHYCWNDNNNLFAWLIIDEVPGHYLVDIEMKKVDFVSGVNDGHPSHIFGARYITDRYVGSRLGGAILQAEIIDLNNQSIIPLVKLSHPAIINSANRCDMHISLSRDKKLYQLDSRHLYNRRTVLIGTLPPLKC